MRASQNKFQALVKRAKQLGVTVTMNYDDPRQLGYLLTFNDGSVYYAVNFDEATRYIDLLDVDKFIAERYPRAKAA